VAELVVTKGVGWVWCGMEFFVDVIMIPRTLFNDDNECFVTWPDERSFAVG
jgi:hypothetical protein